MYEPIVRTQGHQRIGQSGSTALEPVQESPLQAAPVELVPHTRDGESVDPPGSSLVQQLHEPAGTVDELVAPARDLGRVAVVERRSHQLAVHLGPLAGQHHV